MFSLGTTILELTFKNSIPFRSVKIDFGVHSFSYLIGARDFTHGISLPEPEVDGIYITKCIFLLWRCDPTRVMDSSFLRFLDHTQRRTTVGRTPLNEWDLIQRLKG